MLDANGIMHTGAGRNIDEAHKPAIVERKGVKIGFLQYTARWYQDKDMIATATEAGVAKITSIDGVTIDPGDLERARRPTSRSSVRSSTSSSCRITTATARRRCSSARQGHRAPAAIGRRPRSIRSSSRTSRSTPAPTSSSATARTPIQGVEIYNGKPILYAIGHSNFDQPGYEKSIDGLVAARRHPEQAASAACRSCRCRATATTTSILLDPSEGEGAKLVQMGEGPIERRRRRCGSTATKSC